MIYEALGSQVGRRLFLLFALCALLPLLALAGVVYFSGSRYLVEGEQAELRGESKAYAMILLDRIHLLEAELVAAGEVLQSGEIERPLLRALEQRFDRVGWLNAAGAYESLLGDSEPPTLPSVGAGSAGGQRRTRIVSTEVPSLLVTVGGAEGAVPGTLFGQPRSDYLWWGLTEENNLPANTGMLILSGGRTLLSAGELPPGEVARLKEELDHSPSGRLAWSAGELTWLAGSWSLPLAMQFQGESWTIVSWRPLAAILRPIEIFRNSFVLVLAATFVGIVLLALYQIRRTLRPLATLQDATRRVAAQDFHTRVEISTEDEFRDLGESFNEMASRLGDLIADLDELQLGTLRSLARAIDAQSPWTHGHSERVARLSVALAAHLGLPEASRQTLFRAALLHDIGKLGIAGELLNKTGPLAPHERAVMHGHVEAGVRILEPLPGYEQVRPIILQHHERLDGSGYPRGLRADEIDIEARILGVADSYDALSSDRPYRHRLSRDDVLAEIARHSGTLYDPTVVDALAALSPAGRLGPELPSPAPT